MSEIKKPSFTPEQIDHREWRFGMHLPKGPNGEDLHLIKELVVLKDGSSIPNLRVIANYERPLWITKMQYRTHVDKKEWEDIDRLDMHMVRQCDMRDKVAMLTNRHTSNAVLGELLANPFIYGADVPSTAIINRELYQKPNEGITPQGYVNAAFDTETDVLYGTEQIIIGSMTMLPEVHLVIRKDFLDYRGSDVHERIMAVMKEKLGNEIEEHKLVITYELVDTEMDIIEKSFAWFHKRKPDWMSIWNIDFDATKIVEAHKRSGTDLRQYLCDPSIPWEYRIARYKKANENKAAASGKSKPMSSHDLWNVFFLSATFTMVDAMSTYRLLRLGEQEERSYSLDAILEKEFKGKLRKLTHPPADMYVKEKWHQVMQRDHKFVYLAYAAMDTISMCVLDKKTRDLSHRLPALADVTDFSQCNSQPKRIRDAFYIFAKEEHNAILGSVGYVNDRKKPEEEVDLGDVKEEQFGGDDDDEDEEFTTLGRVGWTLTLASHLSAPGQPLIEGAPDVRTNIRTHGYDSDAVSSYPSCTQVSNVSKVTTRKEISKVGDLDEQVFRMQGLNLVFGEVNAIEYSTKMFKAPELLGLLDAYDTLQAEKI